MDNGIVAPEHPKSVFREKRSGGHGDDAIPVIVGQLFIFKFSQFSD